MAQLLGTDPAIAQGNARAAILLPEKNEMQAA
jgi:hypothetical protein